MKKVNFTQSLRSVLLVFGVVIGFSNLAWADLNATVNAAAGSSYTPGGTSSVTIELTVASTTTEYGSLLTITLPAGWTGTFNGLGLGTASCASGTGVVCQDGGNVLIIGDPTCAPDDGCGPWSNGTYQIGIDITAPAGATGPQTISWTLEGDGWNCGGACSCVDWTCDNGTFDLQSATCDISCPADITVDNDPGACGAYVNIPDPVVDPGCAGTPAGYVTASSPVTPYNFDAAGLIATPTTVSGAGLAVADAEITATYTGDHDFFFGNERFVVTGPDGSTVFDIGITPGQCSEATATEVIPMATWNSWVNNYGANLTFTLQPDPDVDDICIASQYQLDVTYPTTVLPYANDYNGGQNASDNYPIGTTAVTYYTLNGAGGLVECTFNVTVNDVEAPTFTNCPSDMVFNLDPGACSIVVTWPDIEAVDNCPPASYSFHQNLDFPTTVDIALVCSNATADDISYYRVFDLDALGVTSNVNVESIDLGVWHLDANASVTVNVYELTGPDLIPTLAELNLLGSTTYVHGALADAEIINIPLNPVTVTPQQNVVIEVVAAGTAAPATGASVGFDLAGETDPTYVYGCTTSLPGFFTDITDLNFFSPRGLIMQANFVNPGTQVVQTDNSGLTSGDEFPIGTTTIEYTATDVEGNQSTCTFTVTVNEYANPTPTLACNDGVQVSLDEDGCSTVGADMILEGGPYGCYDDYIVEIEGGDDVVCCSDIGASLTVKVTDPDTGNSCWGSITVEDKLDPIIECTDAFINCNEEIVYGVQFTKDLVLNKGPQPSYDASSQDFEFNVSAPLNATVNDVNVSLDISHTWVSDLSVILIAPDNNAVTLFAGACGLDDDINVTIDDAGSPFACSGGTPAIAGVMQPQAYPAQALSSFNGMNPNGTWTLRISDGFGGDPTNINSLTLNINYTGSWEAPVATDNCSVSVSYDDTVEAGNCDGDSETIYRTWTAVDPSGNSASCVQVITRVRPTLADVVLPANYDDLDQPHLDCSGNGWDTNGNGYPDVEETGAPTIGGLTWDNNSVCNLTVSYTDLEIPVCDGSYKVRREWTIIDWCTGEDIVHNQLIKVLDTNGPTITDCPTEPVTIPVYQGTGQSGNYGVCTGNVVIAPLTIAGDDCSALDPANYVTELWDASGENLLQVISGNGGVFTDVELIADNPPTNNATYTVTHRVYDSCGNESSCTYTIILEDKVPPVAICDEITELAITNNGGTGEGCSSIPAADLDDGSYDNCGDVYFLAAKMNPFLQPPYFYQYYPSLEYCCDEVGDNMAILLVLDFDPSDYLLPDGSLFLLPGQEAFEGHINFCMVTIQVTDKLPPVLLTCPANVEMSCDDYLATLAGPLSLGDETVLDQYGEATFYDNCAFDLDYNVNVNINTCSEGTITRTWTASDANGSATCTQTISVYHVDDWYVVFPNDITAQCVDGQLPDFGEPQIFDDECELIGVSFQDEQFDVVPDACYKIIRHWSVINWCTYPNGLSYYHDQVIKVVDEEAPIFNVDDQTYCIEEADCDVNITLPTPDVTDCSSETVITVTSSDLAAYAGADQYNYSNVPPGEYVVDYAVTDNCGNTSYDQIVVTVVDCKKPTPICVEGLVIEIMQTGMVEIWASDFNAASGSFDNCTAQGDLKLSLSPDVTDVSRTYTCDDLGQQPIELWVTDAAGNQDFCATFVEVQDNMGACPGTGAPLVAGVIATEEDATVADVQVDVNGGQYSTITGADGYFSFQLPSGGDYTIAPGLDQDPTNGVSTFDMVIISRHILGIEPLSSPYQMIAADVNNSTHISTLDLVELQKVLLLIEPTFPNNTSWRFVDADYVFPNPQNPWAEVFPEVINYNNLTEDDLNADFVGIKIGDVNGSVQANVADNDVEFNTIAGDMVIGVADRSLKAGETYTVEFTGQDAVVSGYQFTLDFDASSLELVDVAAGADNLGLTLLEEGAITVSWATAEATDLRGQVLFSLVFKANASGNLSEMLSISSRYVKAEAYNAQDELLNVQLSVDGKVQTNGFALYQNSPNPFKDETVIGFNLPEAGDATLTIMDASGKVIRLIRIDGEKGYNEVTVRKLNATGVLYYKLETANETATRKMVIME